MRGVLNVWPLLMAFQLLLYRSRAQLFFRAPAFDCSRIHPRYCCTTRVRITCSQLCAERPCQRTPVFVQPLSPHIPSTLPFPGLAPQLPAQPRLPALISPPGLTSAVQSLPSPEPPPGIVLPSIDVPLSVGSPDVTDKVTETRAVDGFAPARGGNSERFMSSIGAGGSFAPPPNVHITAEVAPASNRFTVPSVSVQPPLANTFPTLVNLVSSTSAMPPAVVPPWTFSTPTEIDIVPTSPTIVPPSPTIVPTSLTTLKIPPVSEIPSSIDSQTRRAVSPKKLILPPPNKFVTEAGEELVELESIDRRAIHVDSRAAVFKVERAKDTGRSIEELESGIAKTIIIGTNTFPPPTTPNFTAQLVEEEHEQLEPTARTTVSEKALGGWSFKITPSKLGKDQVNSRGESSSLSQFNNTEFTSQWIANQTQGTTVGLPSPGSDGIFGGDRLNHVIGSIFTKRTIDAITTLTGKRPSKPKTQRPSSSTISSPIYSQHLTSSTFNVFTNVTPSASGRCGVAPEFLPCLNLERANLRLSACCRSRNLPEGCYPLCRYDTTQADIKKAFDAGKCGILNVAPFLECASQGQDNRQCCRQRQIHVRSSPHCEVFCHPRDGLGSLGIHHLVCQNVISDLLQCHHSGLLP